MQEVLPDVREFYPALSPGSRLQSVYGTGVCEMERADVLHLLAQSPIHATELVFEPRLTKQIQEKLHADAEMALQRGKKRHKDENLPEGQIPLSDAFRRLLPSSGILKFVHPTIQAFQFFPQTTTFMGVRFGYVVAM